MPVVRSTPSGLTSGTPYHHVAVGTGSHHVFVAGQIGTDAGGQIVGEELDVQVSQALRNASTALAGAGATFDDALRLTFYVVDWEPALIDPFMAGVAAVAEELGLPLPMPPASLIGVDYLFQPEVLVEVEVNAIV